MAHSEDDVVQFMALFFQFPTSSFSFSSLSYCPMLCMACEVCMSLLVSRSFPLSQFILACDLSALPPNDNFSLSSSSKHHAKALISEEAIDSTRFLCTPESLHKLSEHPSCLSDLSHLLLYFNRIYFARFLYEIHCAFWLYDHGNFHLWETSFIIRSSS